jgi:hypothetical protein
VSQEERLEAHEWFEAEYDSLWNTSAPEEPSVPALAPAASASLPVPALTPAASASASLGSFVDFMASVAGRAFDDLRQCMKEEMLEILMWARINKEKRQRD